ncbi:hypothetical protein IGI04_014906, partial [Brassica rapa subsp. trilocularis]
FLDLRQTLKNFSEDSRKTSRNSLHKSSNTFYARSLQEVFCPKRYKFRICTLCKTLGRLSKDSRKTSWGSLLMYFMLVFRSLLSKMVQRNDVKWSPNLSMLRNHI